MARTQSGKVHEAGFTLIELLVVISIIALLISLLLPALGGAKESANYVKCQAHLQQMGRAQVEYAAGNDDYWIASAYASMSTTYNGRTFTQAILFSRFGGIGSWSMRLHDHMMGVNHDDRVTNEAMNGNWRNSEHYGRETYLNKMEMFFCPTAHPDTQQPLGPNGVLTPQVGGNAGGMHFAGVTRVNGVISVNKAFGAKHPDDRLLLGADANGLGVQKEGYRTGYTGPYTTPISRHFSSPPCDAESTPGYVVDLESHGPAARYIFGSDGVGPTLWRGSGKANILFKDGHVTGYTDKYDTNDGGVGDMAHESEVGMLIFREY